MALGTTIELKTDFESVGAPTIPVSNTTPWHTVIDAGGVGTSDAATVTNPVTDCVSSKTHIFKRNRLGTTVRLCLGYDKNLSVSQNPIIKLFGRKDSNESWRLLMSKAGNLREMLTTDGTNDANDGTLKYTTSNQAVHSWDCDGCDEFLPAIEQALAGTGGVTTNAIVQAKIL